MQKNPLKKINSLLAILVLTVSLAFAGHAVAATTMPHFSLPSAVDGTPINSDSYKGKVTLVTFFATWCPPCIQEIPSLISLQEEFAVKGFTVLGISVDQGGSKIVKRLIGKTGINYPVVMADSKITRDFGGVVGIPTSFLINQEGHVIKNYPGYVGHDVLTNDIKALFQ